MRVNVSPVFCVSPVFIVRVLGGCVVSGMSPVGSQRLRVNVSPVFCVSPVLTVRVLGGCLVSGMYSVHNVTKLLMSLNCC